MVGEGWLEMEEEKKEEIIPDFLAWVNWWQIYRWERQEEEKIVGWKVRKLRN